MRCLTQGHLHTQLGGAGDRTSNLLVTGRPSLPEPNAGHFTARLCVNGVLTAAVLSLDQTCPAD